MRAYGAPGSPALLVVIALAISTPACLTFGMYSRLDIEVETIIGATVTEDETVIVDARFSDGRAYRLALVQGQRRTPGRIATLVDDNSEALPPSSWPIRIDSLAFDDKVLRQPGAIPEYVVMGGYAQGIYLCEPSRPHRTRVRRADMPFTWKSPHFVLVVVVTPVTVALDIVTLPFQLMVILFTSNIG